MYNQTEILVDEAGYCKKYGFGCSLNNPQAIRVELSTNFDLDHFLNFFQAYHVIEGQLCIDEDKLKKLQKNWEKNNLRQQREIECFPIINRGKLWYDNLSLSQLNELQTWYQAWLDVTETLIMPEAPTWINEQ